MTYFQYMDGLTFTINSVSSPLRTIRTMSPFGSTSVCKNAPGKSTVAKSLLSNSSMIAVMKTLLVVTVWDTTSLVKTFLYGQPSTYDFTLIFPFLFFLRCISDDSASLLLSLVSSCADWGWNVSISWCCYISLMAASSPSLPNSFRPFSKDNYIMTECTT